MASAVNFKRIYNGIKVIAKSAATSLGLGEIEVLSSTNKAYFHNGTTASPIVTADHTETLTNKTFDADGTGNSITNIENADIKAAAAIDLTKLAATTVSRALVSDVSGFVSPSTTTATEIGYVNGVTSSIQTQINSAISSASSDLNAHITDPTDAHDASSISNVPSGNLIATDVQGALDELQTDVDTRATSSALTTHISDTATHGATGAVVGTTNTQTLTNKTLTSPVINSPTGIVKGDVGLGNVDNTSDATKDAAVATLTNKTLSGNTATNLISGSGTLTLNTSGTVTVPNATDTLVGKATTDTLTNKTLTAPTLTTPTTDVVTLDGQASSPTNPSAGNYKLFVSDTTSKLTLRNSAGTETTVGSGSGGINYLSTTGDAEAGTTGWTSNAYTNGGLGGFPVDGYGFGIYSANSTWATSTSSPLRGAASFTYTKAAASAQGDLNYYTCAIDPADRGRQLSYGFDYTVVSGTYVDGDFCIAIYDATNSSWIQPSGYKVGAVSVGTAAQAFGTFQTASNTASLYFCVFVLSSSTAAYSLKFDNLALGPQVIPQAAAMTDWTSYTPTGTWSTNTTYTGKWRRVGSMAEYQILLTLAGAPTATTLQINLASGHTIDTASLVQAVAGGVPILQDSTTTLWDNGTSVYVGAAAYYSTTSIAAYYVIASGANAIYANASNTAPFTFGNTDTVQVTFKVPILGWSSNTIVSDSAATRVVAMRALTNTSGTNYNNGPTQVPLATVVYDTHGKLASNVYTIPVPGYFHINGATSLAGTLTGTQDVTVLARINGSTTYRLGVTTGNGSNANYTVSGSGVTLLLNAGDTVDMLIQTGAASSMPVSTTAAYTWFEIKQVQGPAQIQAATIVAARYETAAGQSIPTASSTIVDFGTKTFDTTGSVTTGASWKFTAPGPGIYSVSAMIMFTNTGTWADSENLVLQLFKGGTVVSNIAYKMSFGTASVVFIDAQGTDLISLLAGEYIDIRVTQNSGAALTLHNDAKYNYVSIIRMSGVN